MKYPRYLGALAVVLGLALAGCQTTAPLTAGSSASAGPSSSDRAKDGSKSMGFWYTSFSTTVTVESVEVSGSEASVRFKDLTEQYQASAANGPSSVPSGYTLPQTATFQANGDGWQLDSIAPVVHGGGLPMSVVEG